MLSFSHKILALLFLCHYYKFLTIIYSAKYLFLRLLLQKRASITTNAMRATAPVTIAATIQLGPYRTSIFVKMTNLQENLA